MKIARRFTTAGTDIYSTVQFDRRTSRISNMDGTVNFEMKDAEIPADWSQLATDIMVSKYFRKAGVPQAGPDGQPLLDGAGKPVLGPEKSVRQVVHRLAGCWTQWGKKYNYFDSDGDAQAFYDELAHMLLHQMAAPNSPQWFNTGLEFAYGMTGPSQGHWFVNPDSGQLQQASDAYTHPQPHACQPFDALISTPQGPIAIGEIVTRKLIGLEVFDGRSDGAGTTRVRAVKANGQKPVFRIVLKNGSAVEATGDHLVFALDQRRTAGEWQRVDSLTPGMRMQVSTRTSVTKEADSRAADEATLAGWLQGDGFVGQYTEGTNRSLTLEFITINEDEHAYVLKRVERIFEGAHYHVRHVDSQNPDLTIRRIRLYGEALRPFVEKYNLLRSSEELSVPAVILTAGRQAQAAYLKALFQADGTVRLRARQSLTSDVLLTTVSPTLARGVQTLLLNLGIYARVQAGTEKRTTRRTPYFVSIGYAEARGKFRELIGFVSEEKRQKLDVACSEAFPGKALPALREELILRIELIGSQEVYDIQTESGQYLCGNVLVHNCFIQSVSDDLVNDGGIMDLWTREARLFKYGSGTGTNFSQIRGENESLSGGGKSSGLMSFLKIGDRAAGAIKSGGTTRRAAKMVCLNLDHPDIEEFVNWKVREEIKVAALVEGLKHLPREQQEVAKKLKLKLDYDFNGEAYATVSGQNSNNSVRVPNSFLKAVEEDSDWQLIRRTDGKVARTIKARDLWNQISYAAWRCADPGVQFDDTFNDWHTCPQSGRINATNPCSEYAFLDNTACNLASINLMKFIDLESRKFDLEGFQHACRLWTIVLEISVLMASYPSKEIARLSYDYRTLGLGYANIGTMLMVCGIPYDSDTGRAICGALTALMTGESYATSAEMAKEHGPFAGFHKNRKDMLRVIRNHRAAAYNDAANYDALTVPPVGIDPAAFGATQPHTPAMLQAARAAWDRALDLGTQYGYRNAQTTVIAPTGTIGLLMDCDTTGVEPDFALVKFKKLAGGGYFKIANQSVEPALHNLGYSAGQVRDILTYVMGTLTLKGAPHINQEVLKAKGFTDEDLAKTEACLPSVFELAFAFSPWVLGPEALRRIGAVNGFVESEWQDPKFNLLKRLGFTSKQIREANDVICGTQTIEGAPLLKPEHLAVFDCANRCGRRGKRFIHHMGHIRMMAAAQPFITGAISKTINLPNEVSMGDIDEAYRESWKLGLKAVALYRDGSKLSQPLNSQSDEEADEEKAEATSKLVKAERAADAKLVIEPGHIATGQPVERIIEKIVERPLRKRLPNTRGSLTHKFDIQGHEGYVHVGLYPDTGMPGEIFITMAKQGSTIGGLMDTVATLISLNLQYGVPLEAIVRKFEHMRFEPSGMTMNPDIPFAKSIIDYLVRWLGMEFVPGYRELNAPQRDGNEIEPPEPTLFGEPVALGHGSQPVEQDSDLATDLEADFNHDTDAPARQSGGDRGQGGPSSSHASARAELSGTNGNHGSNGGHGTSGVQGGTNGANGHGAAGQAATHVAVRPNILEQRLSADVALMPASQAGGKEQLNAAMASLMGDAPVCTCGAITVRNGSCYKCLNCGNSLGCS